MDSWNISSACLFLATDLVFNVWPVAVAVPVPVAVAVPVAVPQAVAVAVAVAQKPYRQNPYRIIQTNTNKLQMKYKQNQMYNPSQRHSELISWPKIDFFLQQLSPQ
jgi:hypothetical protein